MTKILVVNGSSYAAAVDNLGDIVCDPSELVTNGADFKLVLFTGGEDVTPEFYNDTSPKRLCFNNEQRDRQEAKIFNLARSLKIRCIGICRGIQFINVMAGGTMWHDVTSHAGRNRLMSTKDGSIIEVTSSHHQMVIPPKDAHIIGWSTKRLSTHYYGRHDEPGEKPVVESEAVLFPGIESAGAQYHPEYMPRDSDGWKWYNQLAKDLIEIEDYSDIIKKYMGEECTNQNTQLQPL